MCLCHGNWLARSFPRKLPRPQATTILAGEGRFSCRTPLLLPIVECCGWCWLVYHPPTTKMDFRKTRIKERGFRHTFRPERVFLERKKSRVPNRRVPLYVSRTTTTTQLTPLKQSPLSWFTVRLQYITRKRSNEKCVLLTPAHLVCYGADCGSMRGAPPVLTKKLPFFI